MKDLLNKVSGVLDEHKITTITNTSDFFKGRLEKGRIYEELIIDELEDMGFNIEDDISSNDDGRFDFQVYHEGRYYTIECKGHEGSRKWGTIYLVTWEKGDYKPWTYYSDIYCGFYWEDNILYSSYISVDKMRDIIESGVWEKYRREGEIGWSKTYTIGYTIPTKEFREYSEFTRTYE